MAAGKNEQECYYNNSWNLMKYKNQDEIVGTRNKLKKTRRN